MNSSKYDYVKINGEIATEFMVNAYTSAYFNVPVAFLSGDELLCKNAKKLKTKENSRQYSQYINSRNALMSIWTFIHLCFWMNSVTSPRN